MAGLCWKTALHFRVFFQQRHENACSVKTACLDLLEVLGDASFNDAVLLLIIQMLIKEPSAGMWMHTYFNQCLN